jgi:hypothetical protein
MLLITTKPVMNPQRSSISVHGASLSLISSSTLPCLRLFLQWHVHHTRCMQFFTAQQVAFDSSHSNTMRDVRPSPQFRHQRPLPCSSMATRILVFGRSFAPSPAQPFVASAYAARLLVLVGPTRARTHSRKIAACDALIGKNGLHWSSLLDGSACTAEFVEKRGLCNAPKCTTAPYTLRHNALPHNSAANIIAALNYTQLHRISLAAYFIIDTTTSTAHPVGDCSPAPQSSS